jgi:hypothetical protein
LIAPNQYISRQSTQTKPCQPQQSGVFSQAEVKNLVEIIRAVTQKAAVA